MKKIREYKLYAFNENAKKDALERVDATGKIYTTREAARRAAHDFQKYALMNQTPTARFYRENFTHVEVHAFSPLSDNQTFFMPETKLSLKETAKKRLLKKSATA